MTSYGKTDVVSENRLIGLSNSTPVDMNLQMTNTYNPFYSGSGTLAIFAELERRLMFQNGGVVLQTASF